MNFKHIFAIAASALPLAVGAQTIDFETTTWKQLGVYDTWEASPFRKGQLSGHVAVIDNPTKTQLNPLTGEPINPSEKVLAVQRSRFGSNTFGARIDLATPFDLPSKDTYLHVWVNRPKTGRVMVVGLGKRTDRLGQSAETEQFWGMTTTQVEAGEWTEAVVTFKGNPGIKIYSLVIVPDCESPHELTSDFVAYIDNISINESARPSLVKGYYPIAYDKQQKQTRTDRRLSAVGLAQGDHQQTYSILDTHLLYTNETSKTFTAKAGETLTPKFSYVGSWMNGYVYLDRNNDGAFSADATDGKIAEGSDLMAFSHYQKFDSNGQDANGSKINPPAFVVPADLQNGYYRMRFKVDWDNIDPAGNTSSDNSILKNGGSFVDIRLNVHGDMVSVNDANRNGEVLSADGKKLVKLQAPFGQDFKIKMNPEKGFEYAGIIVKHGYNLSGDSIVKDNVQWERIRFPRRLFNENDHTFVIPGQYMDGDVEIEGLFIEQGTYVPEPEPAARYKTTRIVEGKFKAGTTWYTLQIGQQGYVIASNGQQSIPLNNTTPNIDDPKQLWCFVGNDAEGFRLYNMGTGVARVLAAPTTMSAKDGGSSFPTMQPASKIPAGYTEVWNFSDSNDLGTGTQYAYLYEQGLPTHKVNNRDNKLAFWSGGQDAGSTLLITEAKVTDNPIAAILSPKTANASHTYDLNGRRTADTTHGLYILNGRKVWGKQVGVQN